jgi:two-component system heavy metal sensor histidine kinase CusS
LDKSTRGVSSFTREKIATFYEAIAEERNIKISCTGEGKIFADPMLLHRALANLLDNALRFTVADAVPAGLASD